MVNLVTLEHPGLPQWREHRVTEVVPPRAAACLGREGQRVAALAGSSLAILVWVQAGHRQDTGRAVLCSAGLVHPEVLLLPGRTAAKVCA